MKVVFYRLQIVLVMTMLFWMGTVGSLRAASAENSDDTEEKNIPVYLIRNVYNTTGETVEYLQDSAYQIFSADCYPDLKTLYVDYDISDGDDGIYNYEVVYQNDRVEYVVPDDSQIKDHVLTIDLSSYSGYRYIEFDTTKIKTAYSPDIQLAESDFTGRTVSILGDSYSTGGIYTNYLKSDVFFDRNYYQTDEEQRADGCNYDQEQWWYLAAEELGMIPLVNNSIGDTGITATGTAYGAYNALQRADKLGNGYYDPDDIWIMMGINDYFNNISAYTFEQDYLSVINIIRNTYPSAHIVMIIEPYCLVLEEGTEQYLDDLLNRIRNISSEQSIDLVDMSDLSYPGFEQYTREEILDNPDCRDEVASKYYCYYTAINTQDYVNFNYEYQKLMASSFVNQFANIQPYQNSNEQISNEQFSGSFFMVGVIVFFCLILAVFGVVFYKCLKR